MFEEFLDINNLLSRELWNLFYIIDDRLGIVENIFCLLNFEYDFYFWIFGIFVFYDNFGFIIYIIGYMKI